MADKISALFDDLQSRGFSKDKTLDEFRSYMLAPGKQGYQNRKAFFDDFKAQGMTDLNSYEDFAHLLGLRAAPRKQNGATKPTKPAMLSAQLDLRQAQRMGEGKGPVSLEEETPKEESIVDKARRIFSGGATPDENKSTQKRLGQRTDAIEYEQETGKPMQRPVINPEFEAPTVARDEFGNIRHDDNGNILQDFSTDADVVNSQRQIEGEHKAFDAMSDEEKKQREQLRNESIEQMDYKEPTMFESFYKGLGAGVLKAGVGLLNVMDQLASGQIVEDASSPTGYSQTKGYNPNSADNAVSRGLTVANESAEGLSRQAQPNNGEGFLDMLWDGNIKGVLQKGVATAAESLPMTLSAYSPYTMVLNGISMAGNNFREQTLENPDIPMWKRASMAVGSAAIEQIVEKYSDPIFKYVGGSKILGKAAKEASEGIANEVTQQATESIAKRIFNRLTGLAKDAAGEGAEEIISNFGNDALGEALDLLDGQENYGVRAQWEQLKKSNPDANLWDFATQKAKEYTESFIGGAMAGFYTSGTTQLSAKALEYSLGGMVSQEEIVNTPDATLDPVAVDVAQAYDDGYTSEDADQRKSFNDEAEAAKQNLSTYGDEFAKVVTESENPVETIGYLMSNRDYFTDEQIGAAADYFQKKAAADGMMEGVLDQIDMEVEQANADVVANTHQATGNVISAQIGDGDYYIIGGSVENDPETGAPVIAGTGGAVVVKDALTGEVSVKPAAQVAITSMQPSDEMVEYNNNVLRQQLMQQADNDIKYGAPANEQYQLDDTVTLQDEQGGTIEGQIGMMPNSVDGAYVVYTADGKALQLTADDMNRRIVAHNGMEVQHATSQAPTPETQQEQPAEQNQAPVEQNQVPVEQNQPNIEQNQANVEQSGNQNNVAGENAPAEDGGQESTQQQSALSRIPVKVDEMGNPFTNKNGKPVLDWHKASVEDAAAALIETTGGNALVARDTASDLVKQGQQKLEKIRKQQPKGDDPIEIAESRMEIQRQVAEQQAINKQWQDVNQHIQKLMREESQRVEAEREAAKSEEQRAREAEEKAKLEEQRRAIDEERRRKIVEEEVANWNKPYAPLARARKEMADDADAVSILDDVEPRSLEEWISSSLRPKSIMWDDEEINGRTVTGLQSELGMQKKDIERIGSLIAPSAKGGKPFNQVVHDIWEDLPDGMRNMHNDQDVRNALIDMFGNYDAFTMRHLAEENRIAEARQMVNENNRLSAEYEMEAWAEANHLTPEERESFEAYMQQPPTEIEQSIINNIFADESYRRSIEENRESDTRGNVSGTTGGESQVQQAVEAPDNGNNEEGSQQGTEAAGNQPAVANNNVPESGGVIPRPEIDEPRFRQLRRNLADAYSALLGEGGQDPQARKNVVEAARAIRNYIDEGLDDYKPYEDGIENYEGNDPEKLADQYITRVFQDSYVDNDEDELYILHGLKPAMREDYKFLSHNGKQFEANDLGVCINPNVMEMRKEKNRNIGYEIRTALTEKGWVGAPSVFYSTGGWSSGVSAGWYDKYFETEKECQEYWAQRILDYLMKNCAEEKVMQKYIASLKMFVGDTKQKPASRNDSEGKTKQKPAGDIKTQRDYLRTFLLSQGEDWPKLVDTMTDEQVGELYNLVDAWEVVNDKYGIVLEENKRALKSKNEKVAKTAKKKVDAAQAKANKAFEPVAQFMNNLVNQAQQKQPNKYGSFIKDGVAYIFNDIDDESTSEVAPDGSKFKFDKNGNCKKPHRKSVLGTNLDAHIETAYNGKGWVGVLNIKSRWDFSVGQDVKKDGTPVFNTEEECISHYANKAIKEFKNSPDGREDIRAIKKLREIAAAKPAPEEEEPVATEEPAKKRKLKYEDFSGLGSGVRLKTPDGIIQINRVDYDRLVVNDVSAKDGYVMTPSRTVNTIDIVEGLENGTIVKVDNKQKPIEQPQQEEAKKEIKPAAEPKTEKQHNRLVSDDKMKELRKRLLEKMNNLNAGIDPELMMIGGMFAVGKIERGFTKFTDYATEMIRELGDSIRPYLKAFYETVRQMPGSEDYRADMDSQEYVNGFDVFNYDKGGKVPDPITKAEQVVKEDNIKKKAKKIKAEQPDLFAGDLFGDLNEPADQPIGKTSTKAERKAEEAKVNTNPSEAQKEAGNYAMGHISVDGYDITIENPKGSVRRGTDANGKAWESKMNNTYGYIRGTEGVDGDHIDVFLSDSPTSGNVFVVDQVDPETGKFDEHKVMYGFTSEEEARQAYLSNYDKNWKGLGNITEVSREDFKKWVESSHRKTKPFADYAMNKANRGASYNEDGILLAPARDEDLDNADTQFYYQGRPVHILLVTRKGEQISATQFSKPVIESVTLTNGKYVKYSDLMVKLGEKPVEPAKAQKPKGKTPWWSDENRPSSIDLSDYKTYMSDEAREYFANHPAFSEWKRRNIAFITAAVWDGVVIPSDVLKQVPEIKEAEDDIKAKRKSMGSLEITDEERDQHALHLLDNQHGSAVFENGKIRKVNGVEDFSGPVRQERKALIIIGLPAGGKSSVFANPLSNQYGARIIDSDVVKPWLQGFDGGNGAGYVQNASSDVAERALDMAVQNGDNIIIPRIGGGSVITLSAALKLANYDVQMYFNDVATTTSVNRAASRFAETGRYLSLDYLTSKDGVPSGNFIKFAEKKIGDYLHECSEEKLQDLRTRLTRLLGSQDGDGTGLRQLPGSNTGGYQTLDEYVSVLLESGRAGGNAQSDDLIYSFAEWKSNDVPFGAKPREIWNSNSGKSLNKNDNAEIRREGLHGERKEAGSKAGQTSGAAERPGTGGSSEHDRAESERLPGAVTNKPATPKQAPKHNNKRNNVGERGKDYAPTTIKARFNANVEAIKLMRALVDDGVEAPTKDQMEALRQYSGWGGMGTYFNDESSTENKTLRDILTDEEYNDAVMSANSAYYTPANVIDTLWDIAGAMGFKGGAMLEGSAGIGNIIGQMPREMSRRSDIEAVEIDSISGNILKLLYPDAKVHIEGFQDVKIPNGSVDLAITNVPFVTGLHVIDKVDKDLSRKFKNIHDFCIAKNIRKLREGGIGIFITSNGTLDKSTDLRAWITDQGQTDVVGAFRLNNETFGGTTVTSDIIVVRKRANGVKSPNAIDISATSPIRVGSYKDKAGNEHQVSMVVNDYFKEHPEMMAGEMAFAYEKGDTFRPGSYGLYPVEGKNQDKMLADFAKGMSKAKEIVTINERPKELPNQLTAVKEGRMLVDENGRLCISRLGTAVPLEVNAQKIKGKYTKIECFNDYQTVQKAVDDALQQQLNNPDDAALKPKIDSLNKAFDNFVKKYGELHKNTSIAFLRNDIDYPSFQALVKYEEKKDMKGNITLISKKSPVFRERVLGFKTEPKPKTVKDALIASIFMNNGINLSWIAEKLNDAGVKTPSNEAWTEEDVKNGIIDSRLGFEDPSTGNMEVYYKYLSGNVREKLAIAESYNADGKYNTNVEELRKVVPMDIPAHLIEFSLGSSWIPMELYKDYLKEGYDVNGKLTKVEGSWILADGRYTSEKNRAAGVYSEKFHETIYGHQIVVAALNNRPIRVSKVEKIGYGDSATTRTVVDQPATQACAIRMDEIKDDFRQFIKKKIQADPDLAERLEKIYNDKFNALVPMEVGEEFMPEHFEGANKNITLYDYQRAGVLRGLTAPTMLAHVVGAGKSFTLITTALEMRRLGTARKPMVVVQNATVAQMTADAKLLYPNAKILSLTEKDRNAEGRRAFYASIKYNDWDLIIVPQSTFERIPDSPERELQFIQEKIDEKKHVIEAAQAAGADRNQMRRLEKELEKIEQEYGDKALDSDPANGGSAPKRKKDAKREAASLDKAETRAKEMLDRAVDDVQFFDDLGIDALLVDEAHEYKHLGFQTSMGRGIKGIDPSYSKKCAGLYNKTRCIFEKAGWKNVVFATGTPISNTAAEIWTFMKYLMPADVMKQNDIYYFDDFVHNFGNISQMLEFTTSGKFKENTRFASYVNRPELIRLWMQVAHIVNKNDLGEVAKKLPKKENGKDQDVFLPQSPSLVNIMASVREELERFEKMDGKEKKENSHIPITMYGIAKRAAIDPRLVSSHAADEPMSKTNAAVKEILADLKATKSYKGTVAVFCDNQNRKNAAKAIDFNIYDDMKAKLIAGGVPEKQIAIIKSGMSIAAKQKVFDAVNAGDIRVVMGSTQTLGTGVNMQERLHLLIHMDAPDRPMDYTQRNGRIERQGNLHLDWDKPIRILRFGVEDSLDVTAYQRLKTKSGFIDSIMDGKSALANNQTDRTVEEEEEGLFDNPVAVLSGSQYALLKNKAERELRKYQSKKTQWEADQVYISHTLRYYSERNASVEEDIKQEEANLANIKRLFPDGKVKTINVEGTDVDMTKGKDSDVVLAKVLKEKINDFVNAVVKAKRERKSYGDETLTYTVSLDGHAVNFKVLVEPRHEWDNGKERIVVHMYTSYESPDLRVSAAASSSRVKDYLDEILSQVLTGVDYQDRIDAMRAGIERRNSEMAQMKQREGKPFEFEKELADAEKQVDEFTELMKKELEEKEAKYAAQKTETVDLAEAEDSDDDDNLYRMADEEEPIFYSNAMRAVEEIRQEKATPGQWLAMITKNGGLKASEDKWLGLSDWLNGTEKRSITKQEIIDFISENQIEVEETRYEEQDDVTSLLDGIYEKYGLEFRDEFAEAFDIEYGEFYIRNDNAAVDLYNRENEDKPQLEYDEYGLEEEPEQTILEWASKIVGEINAPKQINYTRLQYATQGLKNKREIALTVPTIEPYSVQDETHFGDAGGGRAVAWARFGETTDADGKKVLVIDEIQSKRHQDAREKGYESEIKAAADKEKGEVIKRHEALVDKRNKLIDRDQERRKEIRESEAGQACINEHGYIKSGKVDEYQALFDNDQELNEIEKQRKPIVQEIKDIEQEMRNWNNNYKAGVPDAPFERNWHELAIKRMLRYAAENGYDKVAWTTGEQQVKRYDLSKNIYKISVFEPGDYEKEYGEYRNIQVNPVRDDPFFINVDKDGTIMSSEMNEFIGKNLREVFGKELSAKVMDAEPGSELKDNIHIGGEGMKGFYDEILPRYMNKYGKKWGVKVGEVNLPHLDMVAQKMWSIDVTPDMRESVMQGQPMFRSQDQFEDGQLFPIRKTTLQSAYNVLGQRTTYRTDLMPDEYNNENVMLDALRTQYPSYYVTIEGDNVKMQSWSTVLAEVRQAEAMKKSNTKGTESYVQRKTRQGVDVVNDMAQRMHLDVEVLTSTDGLTEKQKRAKGWFNPKTHKIVIVVPNHMNQSDLINTLLHEGVAHYGLRNMFGDSFDTFLDNVYNNVDDQIKRAIDASIKKHGWSRHEATEEYLARLAERTNFENATNSGWWQKIKDFFISMLAKAGFNTTLTDNELRYILWRSYDNLLHPDSRRDIFDKAQEVMMQSQLKVGDYTETVPIRRTASAAESQVSKAETDEISEIISKSKAAGTYMLAPNGKPTNLNEEQWAQVRTKAFKEWFGDWENDAANASKVVDENGEPKVMYHGTDLTRANQGEPFWTFYGNSHFGTLGQAKAAVLDGFRPDTRAKLYEVFLNIRNPQRRNDADQDYLEDKDMSMSEYWELMTERSKNQGHDGIVYLNEYEDKENPADSWIAFNSNQIKSATDNNGDFSADTADIRYSMRTKPAPKKTGIGYKVFVLKNGQLYPPMVANPNGEGTPIGMWLDADAAPIAGTSKTGRPQVKAGGKGTQGGSGQLAYRPGWHLGTIPYALQFNRKDENGEKTLFPNNFVWAEVEYANDVDYSDEAYKAGVNENGKYQHSLAGLKHVPTDGSYMYRTNPNPETDPWVITGAMKVKKILSREEVDELVRQAGREPQKVQDGDVLDQQTIDELNAEIQANEAADEMGLLYRDDDSYDKNIRIKYGLKGGAMAYEVTSEADIAALEGVLADDAISNILEAYNEPGTTGCYIGKYHIVVTFPNKVKSDHDSEISWWHEQAHALTDDMDLSEYGGAALEWLKEHRKEYYQRIVNNYNRKSWGNEAIAHFMEFMIDSYGIDRFLSSNFAGNEKIATLATKLQNGIKYGRERDNQSGRGEGQRSEASRGEDSRVRQEREEGPVVRRRTVGTDAQDTYNYEVAKKSVRWQEAWQDSMVGLKAIQDAIASETGNVATGAEDAYHFENRMHGRAKNMTEQYDWRFYRPMLKAFSVFCNKHNLTQEKGLDYLVSKSGLERNVYYAFRNAMKQKVAEDLNAEREKLEKDYAKGKFAEITYKQLKKDLEEKERTGVDDEMQKVKELMVYKKAMEDYQRGDIGYTEYLRRIEMVINANTKGYYATAARDFSGLTETFAKEMYDDAQNIKKQAQRAIDPREKRALWSEYDDMMRNAYDVARQVAEDAVFAAETDINDTNELWERINAANAETLKTSYESGLIDRNSYNKVKDMFNFYIPLRGWDENKAADVYTYMGKDNVFSPAIKKTWGRTSKAENPLAYIGNIAVSTILSGHKNLLKQHFLNYVMNNPTNLVSISESWYENIGTEDNPIWILRSADTAGKSADEIAQIVNDFNDEMQQKQAQGLAMPVRGRLRLDVNATKGQKAEHVVEVQRAGHTYQLYINGDPKAAHALNGTNVRSVSRISDTYLGRQITKLNRAMAMYFTSKNPAFVVSNLSRDLNMAGASVAINEGAAYNAQFMANVAKVLTPRLAAGDFSREGINAVLGKGKGVTGLMPKLMAKWKQGKLNDANETERYFNEFMNEGGETGFVNMLSVDSFKDKMKKELKEMNGSTLFGSNVKETSVDKALRLLGDTFEFYNRCAEDATRFIVYMTSRQMGKTLEESIADAKDVTLNFNRKGTGGMGNAELRDLFIFVNPAIQALSNMYRMSQGHPLKFGAVTTAFIAGGALMAILNTWALNMWGDDDDKEAYWNLPAWVRKNNLVVWVPGTKNFVTIPLSQEFRVFYGVGEMIASASLDHPIHNPGLEIFSSVADLIPINPTGNGGNLMVDFAPTMVQPLMQIGENIDFTGKPIWKENQGNKYAPAYTKAYVSTPNYMVKIADGLNSITGGNEGKQGVVEKYSPIWGNYINNPAVWNHLLQGYFGGMYNTIAKGFEVVVTAASGELPKVYQTPVINRFLNRPVERDNAGNLGDEYYKLIEDRDRLKFELRVWKKKAADGEAGAQNHVDEILDSQDWKVAEVIDHYDKIMKDLRTGEKAATDASEKANIKRTISLYKQQLDEELNAIGNGKDPLETALEQFDKAKTYAERNKLRLRIERLTTDSKDRTKSSEDEVAKAMGYVDDEAQEKNDTNARYLKLATADDIRNDARIKAAKAKVKKYTDEYKRLQDEGKTDEAVRYQTSNSKWFTAAEQLNSMSRTMSSNKKLLGKGYDSSIMKLIDSNRRSMLKVVEMIE